MALRIEKAFGLTHGRGLVVACQWTSGTTRRRRRGAGRRDRRSALSAGMRHLPRRGSRPGRCNRLSRRQLESGPVRPDRCPRPFSRATGHAARWCPGNPAPSRGSTWRTRSPWSTEVGGPGPDGGVDVGRDFADVECINPLRDSTRSDSPPGRPEGAGCRARRMALVHVAELAIARSEHLRLRDVSEPGLQRERFERSEVAIVLLEMGLRRTPGITISSSVRSHISSCDRRSSRLAAIVEPQPGPAASWRTSSPSASLRTPSPPPDSATPGSARYSPACRRNPRSRGASRVLRWSRTGEYSPIPREA